MSLKECIRFLSTLCPEIRDRHPRWQGQSFTPE